ncbi:hypothetical protein [Novosphingobium terrae]|uniref:hypothetical protein n=1 Tax=Novosphingobium terrae TaxID=2726189 RepID=UPI001980688A|nr:hypothetical protein [Novosphingobium terrae]
MVKRNNYCALQYEEIWHHAREMRDIFKVNPEGSAVIMRIPGTGKRCGVHRNSHEEAS